MEKIKETMSVCILTAPSPFPPGWARVGNFEGEGENEV